MNLPKKVLVKEVGPRDGLQNEPQYLSTKSKIAWLNSLSETGLSYIEVSSFVHPKWIPNLNDSDEVMQGITKKPGVTYACLVPNLRGLERALKVNVDEISVFMSASETHNLKNINKTIENTYPLLKEVVHEAKAAGKTVRGYLSTIFGCPYEGPVSPSQVKKVADQLLSFGIDELALGDTIGTAVPTQVESLLEEMLKDMNAELIAMHFHDTRGIALANILKSLEMGITNFDSALGGIGGCPYAKGATGNVATEDLLYMLHQMGIQTNVDASQVLKSAQLLELLLKKKLNSRQMEIWRASKVDQI
jgi:hydroxymethylglutaryl-CoA lyase